MIDHTHKSYINLDFIRGMSALFVLMTHVRGFVMTRPSELEVAPDMLGMGFYFVTGLGRQAVMIFFVLSGFFISRSILKLVAREQWTWRRYLISRMSRLWAVLLPALLLTLMWDYLGLIMASGVSFYEGELFPMYSSGPGGGGHAIDLTVGNFIVNALFLVGVTTPNVYGSNIPLWSLTYEFWYYMIFPLAYLSVLPLTGWLAKVISAVLILFFVWILPLEILVLGLVWLFGYAVLLLSQISGVQRVARHWSFFVISMLLFIASMMVTRVQLIEKGMFADVFVGFCFSLFMLALIFRDVKSRRFADLSAFLSKISYSLYLTHFPMLAFVATVVMNNKQFGYNLTGIGVCIVLFVVSVGYGALAYWLFERHTYRVAGVLRRAFKV